MNPTIIVERLKPFCDAIDKASMLHGKKKVKEEVLNRGIITTQNILVAVLATLDTKTKVNTNDATEAFAYIRKFEKANNEVQVVFAKARPHLIKIDEALEHAVEQGLIWLNNSLLFTHPQLLKSIFFSNAEIKTFDSFPFENINAAFRRYENNVFKMLDTWIWESFIESDPIDARVPIFRWLKEDPKNKAQILVLNPFGETLKLRAKFKKANYSILDLRKESIRALRLLIKENEDFANQLEVRLFDQMPSINAFIFSNEVFFGHFLSFEYSHKTTFYGFPYCEKFKKHYDDISFHFDTLWNGASDQVLTDEIMDVLEQQVRIQENLYYDFQNKTIIVRLPEHIFDTDQDTKTFKNKDISRYGRYYDISLKFFTHKTDLLEVNALMKDGTEIDGKVQIIHDGYIRCQFNSEWQHEHFALNLVLPMSIKANEGTWIIYSMFNFKGSFSGIGVVQRLRNNDKSMLDFDNAIATQNYPFWEPAHLEGKAKSNIKRFCGDFLVHSYGRDEAYEVLIVSNRLKINPSGYVEYFRKQDNNDLKLHLTGLAYTDFNNDNLFIELRNEENNIFCYFILHIHQKEAMPNTLYAGTYIGLSKNDNSPLGLRIIMECLEPNNERLKISRTKLHTKDFYAMPEGVRELLSGRIENFISFPRKKGKIFNPEQALQELKLSREQNNIGEAYMKAAVYDLFFGSVDGAARNMRRALRNGYTKFNEFEIQLDRIDKMSRRMQSDKDVPVTNLLTTIIKHPKYLELRKEFENRQKERKIDK